ncbi:MAG: hypothetical protein V3S64_13785 [bacterium]
MNSRTGKSKLGWIALVGAVLIALVAYGNASGHSGDQTAPAQDKAQWPHMTEMRDIMHQSRVEAAPLENGVRVTITGEAEALIAAIQREFGGDRHQQTAPAPGVSLKTEKLAKGAALVYTASDPATVKWLKARGNQLVYAQLRENMHQAMAGQGGFGAWMRGMMGGFGGGMGGAHHGQGGFEHGGSGPGGMMGR